MSPLVMMNSHLIVCLSLNSPYFLDYKYRLLDPILEIPCKFMAGNLLSWSARREFGNGEVDLWGLSRTGIGGGGRAV